MSTDGTSRIYEVRAEYRGRLVRSFGVRQERGDAEGLLRESVERAELDGICYDRFWIEEIDTRGLFEIPSRPAPRERYTTRVRRLTNPPGAWRTVHVDVLDGDAVVASYDRDYDMLRTFEPFRQGDRMFALISPQYTATSVLDLHSGEIIATEEPRAGGFCPVGFYVPDWWDLHDGTTAPGSLYWRPVDHEWPVGDFGFVWGCVWGDDTSWKVQFLDLSAVSDGVIRRDDRFGYLKLATHAKLEPRDFIRCSSSEGERRVEFHVESRFNLGSGMPILDEE